MNKGLEALKKLGEMTLESEYGDEPKVKGLVLYEIIEKELKVLNTISQNFKLVGNCLHARNPYAEDGWVFVKELEDEEEHNAWKEVLL